MHVPACLLNVKLKIWCAHTVARKFGMQMTAAASEHIQCLSDTDHEYFSIPHMWCTGTIDTY